MIRKAALFAVACLFVVLLLLGPQASHAMFGPLWTAGSVAPPPPPPEPATEPPVPARKGTGLIRLANRIIRPTGLRLDPWSERAD